MPTIFIGMMLKVLCSKSPIIYVYLLKCFQLRFFFYGSQTDYSLISVMLYYDAKSYFISLLLQLVPLANIFMALVDSFQLRIFQVTILNTAHVHGISQFPAGTSLNSASSTFDWSHISTFPVIIML